MSTEKKSIYVMSTDHGSGKTATIIGLFLKVQGAYKNACYFKPIGDPFSDVKEGKADMDNMVVSKVFADDGPIMKRHRPRAHGRATVIRRRTCHITLEIMGKE